MNVCDLSSVLEILDSSIFICIWKRTDLDHVPLKAPTKDARWMNTERKIHKGIDFMQHYCGWTHSERLKACGRSYEVSLKSLESATDFLPMSFTAASGSPALRANTQCSYSWFRYRFLHRLAVSPYLETHQPLPLTSKSQLSCSLANSSELCWQAAVLIFPDFYQTSPWGKQPLLKSKALSVKLVVGGFETSTTNCNTQ